MRQAVPASARVAAFAALAALCGCAALGFGGERAVRSTSLPVELATWVAADVCRGTFPSADPNPLHAGAPVVRHDPGHFEVVSGRSWHEAYRCAMNGRVRGPQARLRDGELAFEGAHFMPSPHFTDVRGSSDAVFVSIEVGPDSTTVVTWTYGEPGAENLAPARRALAQSKPCADGAHADQEQPVEDPLEVRHPPAAVVPRDLYVQRSGNRPELDASKEVEGEREPDC